MEEHITLSDAFKMLGLNRSLLSNSVREQTNFPKPISKKTWTNNPTYDKAEIMEWYKKKGVKDKIKELQMMLIERRTEAARINSHIKSTIDNQKCHMFLRGAFDPIEKRIEYETKKYNALHRSPKTQKVRLKQEW